MFEDRFKNELDQIKPDEAVKETVRAKMQGALQKNETRGSAGMIRPRWTAAVAAVLCVCVAALSLFVLPRTKSSIKGTQSPESAQLIAGTVPAVITYDAIYDLFDTIYQKNKPKQPNGFYALFNGFTKEDGAELETAYEMDMGDGTGINDAGAFDADGAAPVGVDDAEELVNEGDLSGDYSQTNKQVAEVDEADIVKTDGKYIYVLKLRKQQVIIASADRGELAVASTVTFGGTAGVSPDNGESFCSEIYVSDKRLILIGDRNRYDSKGNVTDSNVYIEFYDISNPVSPQFIGGLSQSGRYLSSRLYNGVLYVFSDQYFYQQPKKDDPSTYVPVIGDEKGCDPVPTESICAFGGEVDRRYLVATSADIVTGERIDSKTVLGGGDTIYVNTDSIYAAAAECTTHYLEDNDMDYTNNTRLIRLGIDKGTITAAAEGTVAGTILNQFSMDAYQGYFRIVTTVEQVETKETNGTAANGNASAAVSSDADSVADIAREDSLWVSTVNTSNALYVLDQDLKQVGALQNLAPGERVYSVRFMGDTGYFVTFRQVDPLFAVDLSEPTAPKVLSALKIPGFSNYLHPFSDGLLLGIGNDADEQTGSRGYSKLSMFDISDPAAVTEQNKTLLDCYWTQVDWTHKAALIDSEKNLIAFMGSDAYYIYGYQSGQGFSLRAKLNLWGYYYDGVRGLYIGDVFYLCSADGIRSYRMDNFERIASLTF